jgi:preprotein translocase subunit SecD
LSKKTAKKVIEYSAAAFLQTLILVCIFPEFRAPLAALIATVTLVTAVVLTVEHFYDGNDPEKDPPNDKRKR